jgi:hypothetical protein
LYGYAGNDPVNGSDPTGLGCDHYYLFISLNGVPVGNVYLGWFCTGDLRKQGAPEAWGGGGGGSGSEVYYPRLEPAKTSTGIVLPPNKPFCWGERFAVLGAVVADATTLAGLSEMVGGAVAGLRLMAGGASTYLGTSMRMGMTARAIVPTAASYMLRRGGAATFTFGSAAAVADATAMMQRAVNQPQDLSSGGLPSPFFLPEAVGRFASCRAGAP